MVKGPRSICLGAYAVIAVFLVLTGYTFAVTLS